MVKAGPGLWRLTMISLVFGAALLAAGPAVAASQAAWTPDARCAAALSVEAEKPDRAKITSGEAAPAGVDLPAADPLPIEALIKMNRAADAARAEGLPRGVVERGVAAFKVEYRRFDVSHPTQFQTVVRSCRLARAYAGPAKS